MQKTMQDYMNELELKKLKQQMAYKEIDEAKDLNDIKKILKKFIKQ